MAAEKPEKPKLRVAADGLPAGHDTPEGAACDLARAFIQRDAKLFQETCIRPYNGGKGLADYTKFLKATAESIQEEAARKEPSPGGPKSIGKVFAARRLSRDGPASYGSTAFDFEDVMFVDVGVILHNGSRMLNRTLVIKDRDHKWYVHPAPQISPLLSWGLNEESKSEQDFSEAYEIQK